MGEGIGCFGASVIFEFVKLFGKSISDVFINLLS